MKALVAGLVLVLASTTVLARSGGGTVDSDQSFTKLMSVMALKDSKGTPFLITTPGFSEDGFTTPTGVCYSGRISGVCELVGKRQKELNGLAASGSHGQIEVQSCTYETVLNSKSVRVRYKQETDYDGMDDNHQGPNTTEILITPCAN